MLELLTLKKAGTGTYESKGSATLCLAVVTKLHDSGEKSWWLIQYSESARRTTPSKSLVSQKRLWLILEVLSIGQRLIKKHLNATSRKQQSDACLEVQAVEMAPEESLIIIG